MSSSLFKISIRIRDQIALGQLNSALQIIYDFVERIITEPLCTSQVFSSKDLDGFCQEIGRLNLKREIYNAENPINKKKGPKKVVYIVSRLQNSGGHLHVISELIAAQPKKEHLILVTNLIGPSDRQFLIKHFSKFGNVYIDYAPMGKFIKKLTWLQRYLLEIEVDHIFLFQHHQDSVAVAALVPELNLEGSFCHHGDHQLCLGVHLTHLRHIDFHPMGYHHCREGLGVENIYMPLVRYDQETIPVNQAFSYNESLTTATVARSNKLDSSYHARYSEILPSILNCTGGRHIHIGRLTWLELIEIRVRIICRGISIKNFIYIKWVPNVWSELVAYKVDLYISAFPLGAGLTLIEAMGAGIPVVMHKHSFSRIHSSLELAYPQAYRWNDQNKLLDYLCNITPDQIRKERSWARNQYEKFHRPEYLKYYIESNVQHEKLKAPLLVEDYRPKYDEWASWAESQLTFNHLIYRTTYRIYRKLRAKLQL